MASPAWSASSRTTQWAGEVPGHFKFAVKVPREITHNTRLKNPSLLDEFLEGPFELGGKLGPLLLQLPPNMSFDSYVAGAFFEELRGRFKGQVVCEPRHPTWFDGEVDDLFKDMHIARVAADPAPRQCDDQPGGWKRLVYYRLHGKPKKYYSQYSDEQLDDTAERLEKAARSASTWCIFDNTAAGAGTEDALELMERVGETVYA